ncbi:MAG: DUF47 family protein [Actinomycetaceae bacterium]|nr:DUF47 family protein [Actinomycetaceae bacterium]
MAINKFAPGRAVLEKIGLQAAHIVSAADLLSQMASVDRSSRTELNKQLHKVENLADAAAYEVREKIAESFVLPYDREDIYAMTNYIDDIVDLIDEAGDNMVMFRIGILPPLAIEMVDIVSKCAVATNEEMQKINKMGKHTQDYWIEINQLENQADKIYRKLMRKIFADDEANALEVLRTKCVVDALEAAIDAFESLAAVVEGIALKES